MRNALASVVAATRRALEMPQAIFAPAGYGFEPSRPEQIEALLRVAGQSLGECPAWMLIAIEQFELHGVHVPDAEEGKLSC